MVLRARRKRLRPNRPHVATSALRVPNDEKTLFPLHAGYDDHHLRHQQRRFPKNRPSMGRNVRAQQSGHNFVCPWLDATLLRLAKHTYHGDDSAFAGQHRHVGRRRERPARALQHPRLVGFGLAVHRAAGLSEPAQRKTSHATRLSQRQHAQSLAAEPVELLEKHARLFRELPQMDVWRQCHCRKQLGV